MNKLHLLGLSLIVGQALAVECPVGESDPTSRFYSEYECKNGLVVVEREYFRPNGRQTGLKLYDGDQLMQSDSWSVDGIHTYKAIFEYPSDQIFIKTVYYPNSGMKLVSKEQYLGVDDDDWEKVLQKAWKYSPSGKLQAIHHFDPEDLSNFVSRPNRVDVAGSDGEINRYFELEYFDVEETNKHIRSVKSYRSDGTPIGEFIEDQELDIPSIIKNNNSPDEAKRKLSIFNNVNRRPVMVIDTGFDIRHPDLTHKLWNNPNDPMDGIDNDGNGFVDDVFGWQHQNDAGLGLEISRNNINETLFITHFPYPVSHGTHVASVALDGVDNFGLIGMAGDVAFVDLLSHSNKMIHDNRVGFVNMSFSISYPEHPQAPGRDSFYQLDQIFKNNPDTLFMVAAGNARGIDLDLKGNEDYPASYSYDNMLVVGALNSAEMDYSKRDSYERAVFSKYGNETVDIYAPGQQVVGGEIAGGQIPLNGTSMATPFVTNVALKIASINPKLTPLQVREIIMKTAYVPKKRLPCVTGGMVDPEAAYALAASLKEE